MAMSARTWIHGSGADVPVPAGSHVVRCLDDFIRPQGMTHGGMDQGMLTYPSDEDTIASETSSPDPEVSIYQFTATDRDDFHNKDWGTVEFAGEHPFEDYNEWFHEEEEECDTYDDERDFCRGD
jgi:hypothetical protein